MHSSCGAVWCARSHSLRHSFLFSGWGIDLDHHYSHMCLPNIQSQSLVHRQSQSGDPPVKMCASSAARLVLTSGGYHRSRSLSRTLILSSLIVFSFLSSSCVQCDIINVDTPINIHPHESPTLAMKVLRNYLNSDHDNNGKTKSAVNESVSAPSEIRCEREVEAVLNGFADSALWAFRSEWKRINLSVKHLNIFF